MLSCLLAVLFNQQVTPVSEEAEKIVALTYDDGPSKVSTADLLEVLKKHDAHATFFVNGNHALENKELISAIVEQGSEIGNHTLDHVWLSKVDEAEALRQVIGNEHLLRFLSGQEGIMPLRPPYGDINQTILDGVFNMIMMCETKSEDIKDLTSIQEALTTLGKELGVEIRAQHADIFLSMHRVG